MSDVQVLLVAGTHGNEINAPWLFDRWDFDRNLIERKGIRTIKVIGNPRARKLGKRYVDRDLNRSFDKKLLSLSVSDQYELRRAQELITLYGPQGESPCQIAFDFHTTTSSMGSCLVIYGRRPMDLALASIIQFRLGLPVYLHEGDSSQTGFLVESWPCGLVVEIGPVAQGLLDPFIVNQNKLILEACLDEIAKIASNSYVLPQKLIIHRHIKSIDFPRDLSGRIISSIHPERISKDWIPIKNGDPLFINPAGDEEKFNDKEIMVPVFINEAAYSEKNIAMSLTQKETLFVEKSWEIELNRLIGH